MIVWVLSLVCLTVQTLNCGHHDPVIFAPQQGYASAGDCRREGLKLMTEANLPRDKWAVLCFEGLVIK